MTQIVASEIKGVWFVAMRAHVSEVYGKQWLELVLDKAPLEFRDVYRAPIASAWYPEATLQEALSLLYEEVAGESDIVFEKLVEGCVKHGIHRMFQLLLGASSAGFVLRMVPTLWRQLRRGAGHVDVEQHEAHTLVRYSEFPWFRDRLYRLMTLGSLRVILGATHRDRGRIEVLEHGHSTLSLRVAHRDGQHERPQVRRASTRPPALSKGSS
jgi:hypothetical protein